MQQSISNEQPKDSPVTDAPPKTEIVRFVFPVMPELEMYALAAVQGFVGSYRDSSERQKIWADLPDARRTLRIDVHCSQRFYLAFRESFPECAKFVIPGSKRSDDDADEMCVILRETRLEMFDPDTSYSIQWIMGQLSGARPILLPQIKNVLTTTQRPLVERRMGIEVENALYVDTNALSADYERCLKLVASASMIVAPQSIVTVLGLALGKPVVEITRSDMARPFLSMRNYVQVSQLHPNNFYLDSIRRGVRWLQKNSSQFAVQSAGDPS